MDWNHDFSIFPRATSEPSGNSGEFILGGGIPVPSHRLTGLVGVAEGEARRSQTTPKTGGGE